MSAEEPGNIRYFGDYELIEQIGRGGMGVVYKGRQISLNRIVALKMIAAGEFATPEAVQRFRIEAEAAAKLDHPNIVPIYEIGVHRGQHYFSMKYVEGQSLDTEIRDGRFKLHSPAASGTNSRPRQRHASSVTLIATIARAVDYAHRHGVVHRDLKPSNILIDAGGQPHLTDFGLAKILEYEITVTRTAAIAGTPAYMSPEQASGAALSIATDIYSLGVILYELLTGRVPFSGTSTVEVLRKVTVEDPISPSALNPSVDRDLATICLKCLEKDPQKRYISAGTLADDLENWQAGRPIIARPSSKAERFWRWCKREPALATLAAAVFVLLLTVSIGSSIAAVRIAAARKGEQRERERAEKTSDRLATTVDQMETREIHRAQELFDAGGRIDALPLLARILRQSPSNRIAAERLMNTLTQSRFARLAVPPLHHEARVAFATFSPDGTRIATCSMDKTACVWDTANGRRVAGPFRHDGEVNSVDFSPDGARIATASTDRTARVWDIATGIPSTKPVSHSGNVLTVRFSHDGKRIVTASVDKTTVVRNLVDSGKRSLVLRHDDLVTGAEFSPDGNWIVTSSKGGAAVLWNAATGRQLHRLLHQADVASARFSPTGDLVVTASFDGSARIWKTTNGQAIGSPLFHTQPVVSAEFSHDGQFVVTASQDNKAQIWNVQTSKPVGPPLLHGDRVRSAMFSPDGFRVVTASWDGTVRVWDRDAGHAIIEPVRHPAHVFYAEFDPTGERFVSTCAANDVYVWTLSGPAASPLSLGSPVTLFAADFSADGKRIAAGTRSSQPPIVWEAETGKVLSPGSITNQGFENGIVKFSPDGTQIATHGQPRVVYRWNVATGQMLEPELKHPADLSDFRYSPDGSLLATVCDDAGARLWDAQTGLLRLPVMRHHGYVPTVRFNRDGSRLVTASTDKSSGLWDTRSGKLALPLLRHNSAVMYADFSPDDARIVTACEDGTAYIWNASTALLERAPIQFRYPLRSAVFSPDGKRLLVTSKGDVSIVDARSGEVLVPFTNERIVAAQFTPDGKRIITASSDRTVRVWDCTTGLPLAEALKQPQGIRAIQVSPDGQRVAVVFGAHMIRLMDLPSWPLPIPEWIPPFAEALSGQRIAVNGHPEFASPEQGLRGSQQDSSIISPLYSHWARWFFAPRDTRTTSPFSACTLTEYVTRLLAENRRESFEEVLSLTPTNETARTKLADIEAKARSLQLPSDRIPDNPEIIDAIAHLHDSPRPEDWEALALWIEQKGAGATAKYAWEKALDRVGHIFTRWDFDVPGNFKTWQPNLCATNAWVANGRLTLELNCDDPWIQTDAVAFSGSDYPRLQVRMKNATITNFAQIYWCTSGMRKTEQDISLPFNVRPNSDFTTYTIDMRSRNWTNHLITSLRIDPIHGAASGVIEIEWIALVPRPGLQTMTRSQGERDSALDLLHRVRTRLRR